MNIVCIYILLLFDYLIRYYDYYELRFVYDESIEFLSWVCNMFLGLVFKGLIKLVYFLGMNGCIMLCV